MRLRNLLILASLCLLPAACADGQMLDIPPVTEANPSIPQPEPVNPPEPSPVAEEPADDNDDDDQDGPHYAPAGDIEIKKTPNWELAPGQFQVDPCVLHPEDC